MYFHRSLKGQSMSSKRKRLSFIMPALEISKNLDPGSIFNHEITNKVDFCIQIMYILLNIKLARYLRNCGVVARVLQ